MKGAQLIVYSVVTDLSAMLLCMDVYLLYLSVVCTVYSHKHTNMQKLFYLYFSGCEIQILFFMMSLVETISVH